MEKKFDKHALQLALKLGIVMEKKSLDDTGTRYKHLKELQENYEFAIEAIENYSYVTEGDKNKINDYKVALTVLAKSIEALAQYNENEAEIRNQIYELNQEINNKHSDMWEKVK